MKLPLMLLLLVSCSTTQASNVYYTVAVQTGDVWLAGTDANVWIRITGSKGRTRSVSLDNPGDDFERGQKDLFLIQAKDVGQVTQVELNRDRSGWFDDWKVDTVEITVHGSTYKADFDMWIPDHEWTAKPAH